MPSALFGYQVIGRLGEGAASVIYAARHPDTRQLVALKHVVRRGPKDVRYIEQLEDEYAVAKEFRHPGLRRALEMKLKRDWTLRVRQAALIMEFVEGTPISDKPPTSLPAVLDCFIQTAKALGALHYLQYVHCDLKPNNIMLTGKRRVKLIDFGQACRIGTVKQRIQGTPDFIAPEQVKCKPVTVQTDIFNFGATLYWALTGQRVPTLYTVQKWQRNVLIEQRFASPAALNAAVPKAISELVMACVRVKPADRPETTTEILRCLEPFWQPVGEDY